MNMLKKRKLNNLREAVIKFYNQRLDGESTEPGKEVSAQLELAKFYDDHAFDSDIPNATQLADECFRAAANLGDVRSQYNFGRRIFDRARFWDDLSTSPFGCDAQKRYAEAAYQEAFTYLQEADKSGSYMAKRLLGLSAYRGWGAAQDEEKGLDLIIASIDQQAGWEKAKDIVTAVGLDPQDFFSKLAQRKANGGG